MQTTNQSVLSSTAATSPWSVVIIGLPKAAVTAAVFHVVDNVLGEADFISDRPLVTRVELSSRLGEVFALVSFCSEAVAEIFLQLSKRNLHTDGKKLSCIRNYMTNRELGDRGLAHSITKCPYRVLYFSNMPQEWLDETRLKFRLNDADVVSAAAMFPATSDGYLVLTSAMAVDAILFRLRKHPNILGQIAKDFCVCRATRFVPLVYTFAELPQLQAAATASHPARDLPLESQAAAGGMPLELRVESQTAAANTSVGSTPWKLLESPTADANESSQVAVVGILVESAATKKSDAAAAKKSGESTTTSVGSQAAAAAGGSAKSSVESQAASEGMPATRNSVESQAARKSGKTSVHLQAAAAGIPLESGPRNSVELQAEAAIKPLDPQAAPARIQVESEASAARKSVEIQAATLRTTDGTAAARNPPASDAVPASGFKNTMPTKPVDLAAAASEAPKPMVDPVDKQAASRNQQAALDPIEASRQNAAAASRTSVGAERQAAAQVGSAAENNHKSAGEAAACSASKNGVVSQPAAGQVPYSAASNAGADAQAAAPLKPIDAAAVENPADPADSTRERKPEASNSNVQQPDPPVKVEQRAAENDRRPQIKLEIPAPPANCGLKRASEEPEGHVDNKRQKCSNRSPEVVGLPSQQQQQRRNFLDAEFFQRRLYVCGLPATIKPQEADEKLRKVVLNLLTKHGQSSIKPWEIRPKSRPPSSIITLQTEEQADAVMDAYLRFPEAASSVELSFSIFRHLGYKRTKRIDGYIRFCKGTPGTSRKMVIKGVPYGVSERTMRGALSELLERHLIQADVVGRSAKLFSEFRLDGDTAFVTMASPSEVDILMAVVSPMVLGGQALTLFRSS